MPLSILFEVDFAILFMFILDLSERYYKQKSITFFVTGSGAELKFENS
ncbi:hypothetical protein D593_1661 [Streptococcus intermedius BA1]|nr:hypothetical protein D593_1661 [Streptococcus intermedius BA1]